MGRSSAANPAAAAGSLATIWRSHPPDRLAVIDCPPSGLVRRLRWGDLAPRVDRVVQHLLAAGFCRGDRLAHAAGNSLDAILLMLAALDLGLIEVPLDPLAPDADRQRLAASVGAKRCDLPSESSQPHPNSAGLSRSLADFRYPPAADDAALILFTSGSSGTPKAVTLSHRNLASNAAAKLAALPQSASDVRLCLLPIWHAYARTCDLGTWLISGGTLAISLGWEGWQRLANRVRPTLINTVPSLAERIVDDADSTAGLSRIRAIGCGGAALSAAAFAKLHHTGAAVIQGYGMTEASPVICSATPDNARPGVVGKPVAGCETRIDSDGRLSVRGPGVMLGYWDAQLQAAKASPDGWLDTGDLIQIDPADGQFRILGRADDRITLANGRKAYPLPIEQRVAGIAGIRHAIVIGCGRHLELWIEIDRPAEDQSGRDGESGDIAYWEQRVRLALHDLPAWQQPRRVCRIPESLERIAGALTSKATPVRPRILALIRNDWSRSPDAVTRCDRSTLSDQ